MKLYAFQPKGHGPDSYFVMAESEQDARAAVLSYIERESKEQYDGFHRGDWGKFGTDVYELSVLSVGEVINNGND